MAEDNEERELGVVTAEQVAVPTQTSVAVVTTTPTTSAYGYTSAQATSILTEINALVADVAALTAYIATLHTAASTS